MSLESPTYYLRAWPQGFGKGNAYVFSERVMSVKFEDTESAADKLEFDMDNFDLSYFDNPIIRAGVSIEASWGYAGLQSPAHNLVVQSVKGFNVLKVVALDRSIVMHKKQRSRTFNNMTRSEVVAQIAKENGYNDPGFVRIQDTEVRYEHIVQAAMTDAAFISSLAKKEGAIFYIDTDGFHWHARDLGQRPIRSFTYYGPAGGPRDAIIGYPAIENDVMAKPGRVVAKGTDPTSKASTDGKADNDSTPRKGLADDAELVSPTGVLTTVTGQDGIQRDGLGMELLKQSSDPTKDGTKKAVDGAFKAGQLLSAQMSFSALGDPGMVAKSIIEVTFPGAKAISGKYYVATVEHVISQSGYIMNLKVKRDGRNSAKVANKSKADPNRLDGVDPDALQAQDVSKTGVVGQVYQDTKGRGTGG